MNKEFGDIYEKLVYYEKLDDSSQEKINLIQEPQRCRFCGKTKPEVSFKKIAHAVSENCGNKRIVSNYECDDCNYAFGRYYEDSFAKYVLPFRIVSHIYGKKTKIKHKNQYTSILISKLSENIDTINEEVEGLIIDKEKMYSITPYKDNSGFTLRVKRQKYNPRYVYLAILKMAYSIMPFKEIKNYAISLVHLKIAIDEKIEEEEKEKIIGSYPYAAYCYFKSGIDNDVSIALFKKKDHISNEYPMCICVLKIGNFTIEIPVPSDSQRGEKLKLRHYYNSKEAEYGIIDFKNIEDDFKCDFSADVIEKKLSDKEKKEIISELKEKKIIEKDK